MTKAHAKCAHCGQDILPGERISDSFAEERFDFCCQGCRGAFFIIQGAGLGRFYRDRQWGDSSLPGGAYHAGIDAAAIAQRVRNIPGGAELSFLVEGIRCTSCVWLNEKILGRLPGILEARVNYANHRARVRFDPALTTPTTILEAVAALGYLPRLDGDQARQHLRLAERRRLLLRFGTAAFLSLQLMGFSLALYAGYFQGMDAQAKHLVQWLAALVATPVVFYAGAPFFAGAWRGLRNRTPGMDLLIALGVLAAYGYSLVAMVSGGEVYFDTAAMIVTLVLLGRLLESGARHRAAAGIERLLALAPADACRLTGKTRENVASSSLRAGDLILVRPGERVPVDAVLTEGSSEFDEAVVSGEPLPVPRNSGDRVLSGTLNLTTAVILRVHCAAADSYLARVATLVEEAQARKAPVQRLAERLAALFVPLVILLAAATALFWLDRGAGTGPALLHAVAVLVVACPCALGLATPVAVMVASGAAARRGIFFRGGDVLEQAGRLQLVAFDKTGTLTLGQPAVSLLQPAPGVSDEQLLGTAAAVESGSTHPLARGILTAASRRGMEISGGRGARTIPGRGAMLGEGAGRLLVGSREFLLGEGIAVPAATEHRALTEVQVGRGADYLGAILLDDPLRPEALTALAALRRQGLATALLSGDRPGNVERVGEALGIEQRHGNLTPQDKAAWIEARQRSGVRVMMVGDGINDAPALATADAGCALAGSTDIALESSDLVLTKPDLFRLAEAIGFGRRTLRTVRQNLFWALIYNLVALSLAASGRLAPIYAAAAMAMSSLCVVGNSLRLTRIPRSGGG